MALNQSNAIGTVQPNHHSVSDWVNNQEALGAAHRNEMRLEDELKQRAEEKAQAKKNAQLARYTSMKDATPTGIKSMDEAQRKWVSQAMDKRLELYKKQLSGQELTPQEEALYHKLDSTPDVLSLMTKNYVDQNTRYIEGVKKGSIQRDLKYEYEQQMMIDGAIPFIDDEGNPVIGYDKDKDGKPDIVSFDMNAGFNLKPRFIPEADYSKVLEGLTKNLKPEINQTDSGYLKTKTTGLAPSDAEKIAKGALFAPDGSPSEFAISYFYKQGIEPEQINDEQMSKLQQQLSGDILLSQPRGVEKDMDYNSQTNRMQERRLAEKQEKEDSVTLGQPVVPSEKSWGLAYKDINTRTTRSIPVNGKVLLPAIPITVKRSDGSAIKKNVTDATLENYTYTKDGRLVIDVSFSEDKTTTTTNDFDEKTVTSSKAKTKDQIIVTPETEARIAEKLGLTPKEMREKTRVSGGAYDDL